MAIMTIVIAIMTQMIAIGFSMVAINGNYGHYYNYGHNGHFFVMIGTIRGFIWCFRDKTIKNVGRASGPVGRVGVPRSP